MSDNAYAQAGVNRDTENETKAEMASALETNDRRVLNKIGAFASLVDGVFPEYEHPVLVLKTEEPGTKQLLALKYDKVESVCHDLINHLVNDCIVMGAKPLSIQDCIVCGKVEKPIVLRMVRAFAEAAKSWRIASSNSKTGWTSITLALPMILDGLNLAFNSPLRRLFSFSSRTFSTFSIR